MVPGHDTSADIWSCGCAYLQMLTAKRPWYQLTRPKDDSVEWLRPVMENPAAMVGKEGRVGLLAWWGRGGGRARWHGGEEGEGGPAGMVRKGGRGPAG